MTIEKKLLGTNPVSGEVLPEAVSFDGAKGTNNATDYLSRTTPLSNQADSKTFTFSTWAWLDGANGGLLYLGNNRFFITFEGGGDYFKCEGRDANNTRHLRFEAPTGLVPVNTWVNILMSFDMSDTSKRHIYINEVDITSATFTGSFPTYTNGTLDFTPAASSGADMTYRIGAQYNAQSKLGGRLAHFFFDYTYRDLSVTANRRLFIDADGKPADSDTLAALNPIMYLPMKDADTAGSNSGTGGNFAAVGTLATAERGPNQDNCVASTFDGSADYLSKTNGNSLSNSKTITCAFTFMPLAGNSTSDIIIFDDYNVGGGGAQGFVQLLSGNSIRASFELTGTGLAGRVQTQAILTFGVHYAVAISFDTANSSKSKIYVNGVSQTLATNTMNNIVCEIDMNYVNIGRYRRNASNFVKGSLGELYFHNTYTDLATENPFWDSDTNRPNSLRKVIEDTGVTPAIAMPLLGNDAGNNLGSGGDFTVNSGPYTGARGGSEFFARSADFGGSNHLSKSSSWGNSSNYTFAIAFRPHSTSGFKNLFIADSAHSAQYGLRVSQDDNKIEVQQKNTSNNNFINAAFNGLSTNTWYVFLASFSVAASKFSMEIRGGVVNSYSTTSLNNTGQVKLQGASKIGGASAGSYGNFDGEIGFVYLSKDYVDISQEVNRHKFIDQLGFPKDLTPLIDAGDVPSPIVYMKFDPSVALETNSGTGGNFTANGIDAYAGGLDVNS